MADITISDPLAREIAFHDATWYGHIVRNHKELANHRTAAEQAIRRPLAIGFSSSDPDCRLYYGQTSRSGLMICVVADVIHGFVKTAYFTRVMKAGAQEWP